jgi:hypothetical protein
MKESYFSGAHIFRKRNEVQVNLEPPSYEEIKMKGEGCSETLVTTYQTT